MNALRNAPVESHAGAVDHQAIRLSEKLEAMKAAGRSVKRTGRFMTVLVAVVALGGVYILLRPLLSAYNNPQPYQDAFKSEMEKQVLPALQEESEKMLKAVGPEILQAIKANTTKRLPEITTKLEQEGETLATELSEEAKTRLAARSDKMLARLEASIAKEVPQAADPDKAQIVLTNGHTAAQNALDRFIEDYLKDHMDTVTNLQSRIEQFPVPPEVQKMTDDQLREHLTETLGVYATRHLNAARSPEMTAFLMAQDQSQTEKGNKP